MNREQKQEASMSVQSRISAATLTELDIYWISEGRRIKSVSQLVSWSLDLLCEILWANQKLRQRVESVAEARSYLLERELIQPSLYERGFDKMGTAVSFEGMREAGIDPGKKAMSGRFADNSNITRKYNMLHNERSIQPFTGKVDSEAVKKGVEIYNNLPQDGHSSILDELSGMAAIRNTPTTDAEEIVVKSANAATFVNNKREADELPLLKERGNTRETIERRIQAADKESKAMLDELNSFDPMSLMGKAVKE